MSSIIGSNVSSTSTTYNNVGVCVALALGTFGNKKLILEAHIFGFNKNIYDKRIKIMLIKFIRGEKKFKNILQLKKQINKDIKDAK